MVRLIKPGETIGILGGGQLGRMMAIAAKQMGYRTAVLDPTPDNPCAQVSDIELNAPYNDEVAAEDLARVSDVVTYEFENVDLKTARWLEEKAFLPQGADLLRVTQDRAEEKAAIEQAGVPVAPYRVVVSEEDLAAAVLVCGLPAVLKTTRGGYDGKGQRVIKTKEDLHQAIDELDGKTVFVLEQWIPFKKELSVIVTRSTTGETTTFPVVENVHVNNMLHMTLAPARVNDGVKEQAKSVALTIANALKLVGTLAVEMFLTEDDRVFVNELAPRPHNSGHYTIEACETSQFEQHVRAICGLPLGSTELLKPAVMVNLLGQHMKAVEEALGDFNRAHLHLYGKVEAKVNRKMGHITILADSLDDAIHETKRLKIWDDRKVEGTV
ncbi:5-(carboxyamino)imidazole ribonucleotide synthase [Camelliibacillus cellulosilyticus]|uniref:N5-carboxyaminoimidazole ribonucleotide synthase n=1 Tax=Camelliibacillus cellulosilyticus TaxID=2174486 RepID=A0ABV9GPW9_9BACL